MNKKIAKIIVIVIGIVAILVTSYFKITEDMVFGVEEPSMFELNSYYDAIEAILDKEDISEEDIQFSSVEVGGRESQSVSFIIKKIPDSENSPHTSYSLDFDDRKLKVDVDRSYDNEYYMSKSDIKSYLNLYQELNIADIVGYKQDEFFAFGFWETKINDFTNFTTEAENRVYFILDGKLIPSKDATSEQLDTISSTKLARLRVFSGGTDLGNSNIFYFYSIAN